MLLMLLLLLLEISSLLLLLLLPLLLLGTSSVLLLLLSGTGCYEKTLRRHQGVGSMCWNDHFSRSRRRIQRLRPDAVVEVVAVASSFVLFFVLLLS